MLISSDGFALLNKMAAMPVYGKQTFKNLPRQNQESFESESWYIASETQGLSNLLKKNDPRMTFDLFTAQSNFCPNCWGNTGRMLQSICRICNGCFTQVSES